MTFHLDENVNNAIAFGLRRHGIDVTVSGEVGLIEAEDEEQLAFAGAQGRVLVTQDRDHLVLSTNGFPHAGIAYWKKNTRTIGQIIAAIVKLNETLEPADMIGNIQWL